jgi:GTPase SAR1 family protein
MLMALLEYREEQARELAAMGQKLESLRSIQDAFPSFKEKLTSETAALPERLEELSKRIKQRLSRVRENTCRVAVIGLEKAGKSTFINAWIKGQALPADRERCTWAASSVRNGARIQAEVIFSTREEFDAAVNNLYNETGLDRTKIPFPLFADAPEKYDIPPKVTKTNEYKDLEDLSVFWGEIDPQLGRSNLVIPANSVAELREKVFPYISRLEAGGRKIGTAYAVKQVNIDIPLQDNLEFTIDDLPGVNAPGNRAEEMTFKALRETADVIVIVKNAASNASQDRDEVRIWKEADEADTSIKLTDRVFVIMSRADEHAVDNNRDAHEQGAKAFQDKGVDRNHIFYCSSTAELYRLYRQEEGGEEPSFIRNPDGSPAYADQDYMEAAKKIANYMGCSEPTSGVPEFEKGLYTFLRDDFPRLELRALEILRSEYAGTLEKYRKIFDDFEGETLSEDTSEAENQRFEALWRHSPERGLADQIQYDVGTHIRPILLDQNAAFLDEIRPRIAASRDHFLKTITTEQFELMEQRDVSTSLRRFSQMKADYFGEVQKKLKEEIYGPLVSAISENVTGHLKPIWDKLLNAKTKESQGGIQSIPADKRDAELLKSLKKRPNPVLEQLFPQEDGKSATITAAGFAAILKSIMQAPVEYLLNSEDEYDTIRERLLQKAVLYRNGICDEKMKARVAAHYNRPKSGNESDRGGGFIETIKNDAPLLRDIFDLFLPRSFVTLASVALKTGGPAAKSAGAEPEKINPFARSGNDAGGGTWHKPQSDAPQSPKPLETPEAVVEELKKRVEVFYFVLEAMLFDGDFGFIGYYRSFLEEFRVAIMDEMEPGGVIKSLASRFRRDLWPDEAEFRANDERRHREEKIAHFKRELGF